MRDRFTFFRSYGEALENLPDEERLKCYDAIYRYAIFGEEPELDGIAKGFFTLMKPNIDKSIKRADAGKIGGESEASSNQTESKPEASDKQTESKPEANNKKPASDKDKDKDKDIGEKDKEKKNIYGEYKHVKLTKSEYERLLNDYGEQALLDGIKNVDEYCQQHGKSYKDYNLTLRNWGIKSPKLEKPQSKPPDKNAGLEKRINPPEDETDVEAMRLYDEDRERHRWQDGWLINDDGYWIKRDGIV